jgi:predicted O-methyltransferase YrrM
MSQISEINEDWLKSVSSPASDLLEELENKSAEKFPRAAHMMSGFSQGRLIALLSGLLQPSRILEIGTFTGYGSICLAEGLAENGLLYTIENSAEHAAFARTFFERSAFANQIRLMEGKAEDIIPLLNESWDLVYLDADKTSNRLYIKLLWASLKPGGIILVDNVFARGGIFKQEEEQRAFEKAVTALNHDLPGLFPDGELFVLPIRDGLSILRKKA